MKRIVHVIPHTHWDREWYFNLIDSNIILDQNLTALITYLNESKQNGPFLFDGQTSVIHDYLMIRPEQKQNLMQLIQEGRLLVGPWVTQCDTRLISQESVIRNLKIGIKEANQFGKCFQVGYVPDAFGQNSYLPSIFKQFQLRYAVIQRGIANNQLTSQDLNMNWESPDGQRIMTHYLYFGYGPGKFLSSNKTYVENHLTPILEQLSLLNQHTKHLALPAGGDQVLYREHLPKVIEQLNQQASSYHFVMSNYEDMLHQIECALEKPLTTIKGELMHCQKSRIHRTIASTRYDIKQLNSMVEHRILYQLEPLMVYAHSKGIHAFNETIMTQMWRKLFDVHAHDSISGCNSDRTNQMIINRLMDVLDQVDGMINVLMRYLTQSLEDGQILIFNPLLRSINQPIEVEVDTNLSAFELFDQEGNQISFTMLDNQIIDGGTKVMATAKGEVLDSLPPYHHVKLLLHDVNLDAFSHKIIHLTKHDAYILPKQVTVVENIAYQVFVEDHQLYLFDKKSQRKQLFLSIVDDADQGDTYDFAYVEGDKRIKAEIDMNSIKMTSTQSSQQMVFDYVMTLPEDLQQRKQSLNNVLHRIKTIVTLQLDGAIWITHHMTNHVKEHRVRTLLHIKGNVWAKQAFGMIQRDHEPVDWKKEGYVEQPLPVDVMDQMIHITGDEDMYVLSQQMKEYEVVDDGVELTLFRSVPFLGKDNLTTRPGRASGINNTVVETPDALLLKPMTFTYAVTPNADWQADYHHLYQTVLSYQKQQYNLLNQRLDRFELPCMTNIHMPLGIACHPSLYQSSFSIQGNDYVLRLANLTQEALPIDLTLDHDFEAIPVLLDETTIQPVVLKLEPNQYATWLIKRRTHEKTSN